MKKIMVILMALGCMQQTAPANGENRKALKFLVKTLYKIATEKPPKKQIIVPPYSMAHSFKNDYKSISAFLGGIGSCIGHCVTQSAPQNQYARAIGTWISKHGVSITASALLAATAYVIYKATQGDDDFRILAQSVPTALTFTYIMHKVGQYSAFKRKYRLLIAANQ